MAHPKSHTSSPLNGTHQRKSIKHMTSPMFAGNETRRKRARIEKDVKIPNNEPSLKEKRAMFLSYVEDALKRRATGDLERYEGLVKQFKSLVPSSNTPPAETPSTTQIRVWLETLTHSVSLLDKTHAVLVETILDLPWAVMEESIVNTYVKFVSALVSARQEWLKAVLERCIRGLRYKSIYTMGSKKAAISTFNIPRKALYTRLHLFLQLLLSLVPTLASSLFTTIISKSFPPKRESKVSQMCYIDNLLRITEYCPAIAEDVMGMIIERAVSLDVLVQGDYDDIDEAEQKIIMIDGKELAPQVDIEAVGNLPTNVDDSSDDESDDGEIDLDNLDSDDDEPDPINDQEAARLGEQSNQLSEAAYRKILDNREKLDSILKVVLDYISTAYSSGKDADRRAIYNSFLDIFDRTLLTTFKTRSTQFVMFYLCSLDSKSTDHFIGVLLNRALFDRDVPEIVRVAAVGYLASFISRAKFVGRETSRQVMSHLCKALHEWVTEGEEKEASILFYASCQAALYIFCFRWNDFKEDDEDAEDEVFFEVRRTWMFSLDSLKRAINSPLNPLKMCANSVVNEFANLAHRLDFMYCYAIIESNRRSTHQETPSPPRSILPNSSKVSSRAHSLSRTNSIPSIPLAVQQIDSFFPFDPYKLRASKDYFEGIYRQWGEVNDFEDDDADSDDSSSESSDSEDEKDDEKEQENLVGGIPMAKGRRKTNLDAGEEEIFSKSFEAMSLSPRHTLLELKKQI